LPFNLDGASTDAIRADGDFDGKGHTLAAELLPAKLELDGVPFKFGSGAPAQKNVLVPAGQTLAIPQGNFNRVYILAAAIGGDVPLTVSTGAASKTVTVREWQGPVGQWWSRLKDDGPSLKEPFAIANGGGNNSGLVVSWDPRSGIVSGIDQIRPAYVKRDEIAWIGTHRHDPKDNEAYVSSYVFTYVLDLPAGTREIKLPANDKVRVMAVSVATESTRAVPAGALYMADFAEKLVVPPAPPAIKSGTGGGK
jgi:alpha-mannosidase